MLTHILKPIQLGTAQIKNRVVRTAHGSYLGRGIMGDDLIAYHAARARGGVGLSIIEILAVHWSTPSTINGFAPNIADGYRKLVDTVAPTGMKLFQQLWHGGHNALPADGSPPWSASDLPSPMFGQVPIPMTKAMIDEIVGAYADMARRCEAWGLDGVEVHAAHGYLIAQFLSPSTNFRDDDYGGSFENRLRFLEEILNAVRASVSRGFPVGVRVAPEEIEGGINVAETLRIVQALEDRGLVDYVNISLGNYQNFAKIIGGMHEPAGYELPTSTPIARATGLPTIVTGRFRTLEEGDQVIRSGEASMVSYVRALIADPDLVNKTAAGHPEQVRPCIACNQGCLGRVMEAPYHLGCAVNPGVGAELRVGDDRLVPAVMPKRVLIVGGGPAGMEAARVAALRGHKVTLTEATADLGGTIIAASRAPMRHGLRDFTTWLEEEVYRLGVEVRLSTYIEEGDVDAAEWDAVIVATGALPRMDGVQNSNPGAPILGMEQSHVLSSNDLFLGGPHMLGSSAVVIDDSGHYEALACAEHLAGQGLAVALVTRFTSLAPRMESPQMVEPALQRMTGTDFTAHLRSRALRIDKNSVHIGPVYFRSNGGPTTVLPADTVIFVSQNRSDRALFTTLAGRCADVRLVGDANSPRQLPIAVQEGHLAGASV
ncbi:oxidoreductase [Sphingomonas sp. SRS2]|uniref:oxidoreductase n=1 Tax=Sphingomonas sp. SRS2 TaxID=133190 RepID=UPI0006184BDE|nr:FAD-dependent oxidoreductase [Sphingomonas sp. SRS2]KKC26021.1 hypothetical protein WP12_10370 [Sphingomonas sp. SRS2]